VYCEDTEAETKKRNGEQRLLELNEANDFKKETNSINFMCNMFSTIYFLSHLCSKNTKLILKM
jgi:hypothetical protein